MLAGIAAIAALATYAVYATAVYSVIGLWKGGEWLMQWITHRRQARAARAEAELDRTQDELRATVLRLAAALGMEAHEARKALIRESYLVSGRVPPTQLDSEA